MLTRRVVGESLAPVCKELGEYLAGGRPTSGSSSARVFRGSDEWVRHRLRALQLKHWKRGPTISANCVLAGW